MSKTIIGLIIIVMGQFVPAEELSVVMEAIGIVLAWYGRIVAVDNVNWLGLKK